MHKGKIMLKKTDVVYLSGPMSDLQCRAAA